MENLATKETEQKTGEYKQELKRVLKLRHLIIYGMVFMGLIAPWGIYGFVSKESYGMVPLVYLIGIVAMLFTALSYKQMSREFPFAGSVYSYVQRGLHPYIGFIAGWMILADYLLLPSLLYAFTASWLHDLLPSTPPYMWVLIFAIINTIITGYGITLQAATNFVMAAIELISIVVLVLFAIHYVFIDGHGIGGFSIKPFYQPEHLNWDFVATAASIAMLSFLGFDAISTLAEETERPRKTVGNATILVLLILGVLFMLQTYLAALAHPDYKSLNDKMAYYDIGRQMGGNALYYLLILVSIVTTGIANALAGQSAIARILNSMGLDKVLPFSGFLCYVHPRFQTPLNAIVGVGVISVLIATLVPEETIIKFINFGALTSFILLNLTVIAFFYIKKRQRTKIFRYLLFPLLGALIVGFVWSGFNRITFIFGGCWCLAGILVGLYGAKDLNLTEL
jgi:amino acid transporter